MAEEIAPSNHTISQSNDMEDSHFRREPMSAEELAKLYFEQLDEEEVWDLYRVYGYDVTFEGMTQGIIDRS